MGVALNRYLNMEDVFVVFVLFSLILHLGNAIRCYSCTIPPYPGADLHTNRRDICPDIRCPGNDEEQVCVKVLDRRGSEEIITRACLWDLRSSNYANLLPGDVFTGCRKPADDVELSRPDYYIERYKRPYENLEFCFCDDWWWCNSSSHTRISTTAVIASVFITILRILWH